MHPDDSRDLSVRYLANPTVTNRELNALFAVSWAWHPPRDFLPQLDHSLTYVCAYAAEQLIGFVYLAWDGGIHAFVLDPTVHPDFRRRGIGRRLIREAITVARRRGIVWLHVDFEPHLGRFYRRCGFHSTEAGLLRLAPG